MDISNFVEIVHAYPSMWNASSEDIEIGSTEIKHMMK